MSAGLYSRARAPPESRKRWLARVQASAWASTRWKSLLAVSLSPKTILEQPERARPEPAAPAMSALRRVIRVMGLLPSVMVRRDRIAAGDHGLHLVDRPGQHDLHQVDDDEGDDAGCAKEVD